MIYVGDNIANTQPFQHLIGTSAAVFVVGEVLKLTSGKLIIADFTSAGEQLYICQEAITGDGVNANIAVLAIRKDSIFEAKSTGQLVAAKVGTLVTLHTDGVQVTIVATAGVFRILETDGATLSTVRGQFV
jgi:hypothetical protein